MITQTNIRTIEPDVTVLEISGRLSLGNSLMSVERTVNDLIAKGTNKLIVDVSQLSFIDSAGIGMLVALSGSIDQAGGKMCVAGSQGAVAETFRIVHLNRIMCQQADVDAAVKSLTAGAVTGS